ncbi:MAG: hypothetical protein Q7S02_01150 [bacterium]|nr:hypothetical protein [bacterium]
MENQNPPPFPFDAFDAPFDMSDDLSAADLFPSSVPLTAGDRGAALQAIRRKLQELDDQLRTLLTMIDRELHGGPAFAVGRVSATPPTMERERMQSMTPMSRPVDPLVGSLQRDDADALRVIEGVFDGQNMVGPDGKQYSVPANYASKSKLVEGDILKLRITQRGAFVYKQIGPIARDRRIGIIERDDVTTEYVVIVPDADEDRSAVARAIVERADLPSAPYKRYRMLRASVTFYRGEPGDEAVVFVPKDAPSTWAAVENIVKR